MGNGTVRRLEDEQEKIYGLTKIMEHMAPGTRFEFHPGMIARTEGVRIGVEQITGQEWKWNHGH